MEGRHSSKLIRVNHQVRPKSRRKYLVRYVQCSPDSDGFDPYNDYMLDLLFNSTEEAHRWCRKYVDPYMEESSSDTSILGDDGMRREAHIIRCMVGTYDSPDHLHQLSESYMK